MFKRWMFPRLSPLGCTAVALLPTIQLLLIVPSQQRRCCRSVNPWWRQDWKVPEGAGNLPGLGDVLRTPAGPLSIAKRFYLAISQGSLWNGGCSHQSSQSDFQHCNSAVLQSITSFTCLEEKSGFKRQLFCTTDPSTHRCPQTPRQGGCEVAELAFG